MKTPFLVSLIVSSIIAILFQCFTGYKWFSKGIASNDPKEKIGYYTKSIEKKYFLRGSYNNRGLAYACLGLPDSAIADYDRSIRIAPKKALIYFNRGLTYGCSGQTNKAIADFSEAIRLRPRFSKAYFSRGNSYSYIKQYEKSISDFRKCLELDKKNIEAYRGLGIVYSKNKDYNSAVRISLQGLAMAPGDAQLSDNLGYYYLENDELGKAISGFSDCLKTENQNIDATLGMSIAYYSKRDTSNARLYLNYAKKLEPCLNKGMDGITELINKGYFYSDKNLAMLRRIFDDLK